MIPEFGLSSEPAQLDHGQSEIESITLGLLDDLLIQFEAWLILRGVRGYEPAIVADWDEDTDIYWSHLVSRRVSEVVNKRRLC